ncbi:unnamed protein product [Lepeophtheirus salmonis]|uniref:(salmon louse) hypothetical protein n=1 Tax=Lepeophtheirus salmonis TaxID=72036 RepID=A0A7R8CGW9_LEPSM|nr:unnamed protein product [Lepeophtheirus salmonis]CAF2819432.1 unnamed protein product [Lepeophtheirus salmonis]
MSKLSVRKIKLEDMLAIAREEFVAITMLLTYGKYIQDALKPMVYPHNTEQTHLLSEVNTSRTLTKNKEAITVTSESVLIPPQRLEDTEEFSTGFTEELSKKYSANSGSLEGSGRRRHHPGFLNH